MGRCNGGMKRLALAAVLGALCTPAGAKPLCCSLWPFIFVGLAIGVPFVAAFAVAGLILRLLDFGMARAFFIVCVLMLLAVYALTGGSADAYTYILRAFFSLLLLVPQFLLAWWLGGCLRRKFQNARSRRAGTES
jgi:hypothetical protein